MMHVLKSRENEFLIFPEILGCTTCGYNILKNILWILQKVYFPHVLIIGSDLDSYLTGLFSALCEVRYMLGVTFSGDQSTKTGIKTETRQHFLREHEFYSHLHGVYMICMTTEISHIIPQITVKHNNRCSMRHSPGRAGDNECILARQNSWHTEFSGIFQVSLKVLVN